MRSEITTLPKDTTHIGSTINNILFDLVVDYPLMLLVSESQMPINYSDSYRCIRLISRDAICIICFPLVIHLLVLCQSTCIDSDYKANTLPQCNSEQCPVFRYKVHNVKTVSYIIIL